MTTTIDSPSFDELRQIEEEQIDALKNMAKASIEQASSLLRARETESLARRRFARGAKLARSAISCLRIARERYAADPGQDRVESGRRYHQVLWNACHGAEYALRAEIQYRRIGEYEAVLFELSNVAPELPVRVNEAETIHQGLRLLRRQFDQARGIRANALALKEKALVYNSDAELLGRFPDAVLPQHKQAAADLVEQNVAAHQQALLQQRQTVDKLLNELVKDERFHLAAFPAVHPAINPLNQAIRNLNHAHAVLAEAERLILDQKTRWAEMGSAETNPTGK